MGIFQPVKRKTSSSVTSEPSPKRLKTKKSRRPPLPTALEAASEDIEIAEDNDLLLQDPLFKQELARELKLLNNPLTFKDEPSDTPIAFPSLFSHRHIIYHAANIDRNASEILESDTESANANSHSINAAQTTKPELQQTSHVEKPFVPFSPLAWPTIGLENLVDIKTALITSETRVQLDPSEHLIDGSLWSKVRKHRFPFLKENPYFVRRPAQIERDDFLKACFRLGHIAHPQRLSMLLGSSERSSAYCEFLLSNLLGLFNRKDVRDLIGSRTRFFKSHRPIPVYKDGLYPENDIILRRIDGIPKRTEERKESQRMTTDDGKPVHQLACDSYEADVITLVDEPIPGESDEDEPSTLFQSKRLKFSDPDFEAFADHASYVLRSYMNDVSGETFFTVDDFAKYSRERGISFLDSEDTRLYLDFDRLKWLDIPTMAATLGEGKTSKEPIELWRHAMKRFGAKDLARCALIQTDSLLDWLEYIAVAKDRTKTVDGFFSTHSTIICFSPIALLYLADTAATFALSILQEAIEIAFSRDSEEENVFPPRESRSRPLSNLGTTGNNSQCNSSLSIGIEDIEKALRRNTRSNPRSPFLFAVPMLAEDIAEPSSFIYQQSREWPQRKIRPLTVSETFELCSSAPKVKLCVPKCVMEESRALLLGRRSSRQRLLYYPGCKKLYPFLPVYRLSRKAERRKPNEPYRNSINSANVDAGSVLQEGRAGNSEHEIKSPLQNVNKNNSSQRTDDEGDKSMTDDILVPKKENDSIKEKNVTSDPFVQIEKARGSSKTDIESLSTQRPNKLDSGDVPSGCFRDGKISPESEPKIQAPPEAEHVDKETNLNTAPRRASQISSSKDFLFCPEEPTNMDSSEILLGKEDVVNRKKRYADFFNVPSIFDVVIGSIDSRSFCKLKPEEIVDAMQKYHRGEDIRNIKPSTADIKELPDQNRTAICYRRLKWIMCHSLGISSDESADNAKPTIYASTTNYTNFRHFQCRKTLSIDTDALSHLASVTELIVREEAEILKECATHDDCRPWIDRADVALVHAVRKLNFPYKSL